ncbi:mRNA (2'-O-methyladenosine-N(6)-)-methyltransferase [Bertholletia excelsa]
MDNWSDRNREWEGSKDGWKRKQRESLDEAKDGYTFPELGKEWELQRRNRDRMDRERFQGHFVGRKDGGQTEAVKTYSKYGISRENYDVIEIQREGSASTFSRRNIVALEDGARRIDMGSGPSPNDQTRSRGDLGEPSLSTGSQSSASSLQPSHGKQDMAASSRTAPQEVKGGRGGRGRAKPVRRDSQQVQVLMPMMGSPFGLLGMPHPGCIQPLSTAMSSVPIPPISPGFVVPPFPPPIIWPGPRGVEMNMLAVLPGLPPLPSGTSAPRFPNKGIPASPGPFFVQSGTGQGLLKNTSSPGFDATVPMGQGEPQDNFLGHGGQMPPRNNTFAGKALSRVEQNDYSQNFVDTGMRPQNFIRELELTSVVEDYPKLRELIQKKDEIVVNSASPPMYYRCDLHEFELSSEFFGTKFDVILVDPPWEEYVHRAPGVTDHMEYWTFEEIMNLKIEAIADVPSFIFLWVGDGVGLEQGRQCLKKWGFRRCEDICWVKTNKTDVTPSLCHDSHTLFQRSKEHCLMGIKGTVRRSTDGHIIHANIDTDVIIAEEPPYGSTKKPEEMYRIIEHFVLGRRRLELFGEDHNIRSGWLTVGKGLSSSNFDVKAYIRNFADKDGKVWQGGGRNPPPKAPHLVLTTPEIEALRPKSPMKNQQQLQQQSKCISIIQAKNSPQNYNAQNLNKEASSFNPSASSPFDDRISDMYGFNSSYCQANRAYLDYESYRAMNML